MEGNLQDIIRAIQAQGQYQQQHRGGGYSTSGQHGMNGLQGSPLDQQILKNLDPGSQRGQLAALLESVWSGNSSIMGPMSPAARNEKANQLGALNGNTKINQARTKALMNQYAQPTTATTAVSGRYLMDGSQQGGGRGYPQTGGHLTVDPQARFFEGIEKRKAKLELETLRDMLRQAQFDREQAVANNETSRARTQADTDATKKTSYHDGIKQKMLRDLLGSLM